MRKAALTLTLILAATIAGLAQSGFIHRNIGLDSLISIMQERVPEKIYYTKDATAASLAFTINTASPTLLEEIQGELQSKGYSISRSEGLLLILKGAGIKELLPDSWFALADEKKEEHRQPDYLLGAQQNLALSQNKVYQVGEKHNAKKGNSYVSGYVRDSRTGEPVIGVTIANNASKSYAQSDGAGFYKILLPAGENTLDVSGYSLEDSKVHLQVYNDGTLDIVVKEKVYALTGIVVSAENTNKVRNNEIGIEKVR
ncbi:MAG: carboxypeptidase-like regulatory domain-containing protein, partial [Bacteroidales bacterium]|nr:carboxypeptidase-like regulatory domain-containing protein [Bacteroidales bacterium]